MDISIPSVLLGVGVVGGIYFASLVATKGLKAAWAFIKSKASSVEASLVADVQKDIAVLRADVAVIKTKVGL
jgi:hypothetical protein